MSSLVGKLWEIIESELRLLNRGETTKGLLENLESINLESVRWKRTIRSTLSLHIDKQDVLDVTLEQISALNAASTGSRIALEMALCECPLEGGLIAGKIELTKILAYAVLMHKLGNWSDSIKYELRPALVKISPLGDLLFDVVSDQQIVFPYAKATQSGILKGDAADYSKLFEKPKVIKSVANQFDQDFVDAWLSEFGFSIDEGRVFLDALDDKSIAKGAAVFALDISELSDVEELPVETVAAILQLLILWPRESWPTAPEGYSNSDWYPWRFKRKLSFIAKPIIKLEDTDQSSYLIAPGLIRDSYIYLLNNCLSAVFDQNSFKSNKMKGWVGTKRNLSGHAFNTKVAEKLRDLGWDAEHDLELPGILNAKLDKAYGDIDVFAWNKSSNRVLAIECKDLQFAKTEGEIAKQLYEFRGKDNHKGKPDRLKKHLQRITVLDEHKDKVRKYADMEHPPEIETVLIFSSVVPMAFSDDEIFSNIAVCDFDSLECSIVNNA